MKYLILLALLFSASAQSFDTARFDQLLQKYVNEKGFVNYRGILKNERETVNELARQVNSFSPKSHPKLFKSKKAEMVYWINTYNLLIIKTIIDEYPVESIKDIYTIGALIWKKNHPVGGEELSFDNIEHDILRKQFFEPRIHFAINCASYGCPILQNRAFTVKNLEELLAKGAIDFFSSDRNFYIDEVEKTIYLSAILDWFEEDFYNEDKGETVLDFVIRYAPDKLAKKVKKGRDEYSVSYIEYDWRLNEQSR